MKFVKVLSVLAVAGLATIAHAKTDTITYGGTKVNQPYVGVKFAQIDSGTGYVTTVPTVSETNEVTFTDYRYGGPAHNNALGIYAGYNFDEHFGAEAEFLVSAKKDFVVNIAGSDVTYQQESNLFGAYGTYRYNFENTPFYAKAKLGFARTNVDMNRLGRDNKVESHNSSGAAYGIGAGYNNGKIGIEASFSHPHSDVDVVSVGAHMAF